MSTTSLNQTSTPLNQTSTPLNQTSTPLNQTSTLPVESSAKLGPPLITLGAPTKGTPLGSQPSTNNFVQYENPTYRYTIQYPSNWQVEEDLDSETARGCLILFTIGVVE